MIGETEPETLNPSDGVRASTVDLGQDGASHIMSCVLT